MGIAKLQQWDAALVVLLSSVWGDMRSVYAGDD